MCVLQHALNKLQFELAGPETHIQPTCFCWAWSSPAIQAGPDSVSPSRLLVQTSNLLILSLQACVNCLRTLATPKRELNLRGKECLPGFFCGRLGRRIGRRLSRVKPLSVPAPLVTSLSVSFLFRFLLPLFFFWFSLPLLDSLRPLPFIGFSCAKLILIFPWTLIFMWT